MLAAYERAPGVTRQRLYYETIEEVLGSTNKVLVDTEGTGNMLYLPLDKLTERRAPTLTLDEQRQSTGPAVREPPGDDAGRLHRSASRARQPLMGNRSYLAVFALGALVLLLSMAAFTVRETELAIKFRFGEIVRADYQPGLHFMVPFVNNVRKFDRRILTEDYPAEQFLTSEGKILRIDFFVKWRIADVSRYYLSTAGGTEEVANRRLGEIVKDGIKGVIARRTIQQVVAAERSEFLGEMLKIAGSNVSELGITLVDVRVKSIDLPEEVSESVFNRMRQDFARQAAQLRAEGRRCPSRRARRPSASAPRSSPTRTGRAEIIRGEGDAAAADIYARAYGRNPEFYSFYRGLQAYRRSLGKQSDVLVITPDGEFFKYLKDAGTLIRAVGGRTMLEWNDLWAACALYLVHRGPHAVPQPRRR